VPQKAGRTNAPYWHTKPAKGQPHPLGHIDHSKITLMMIITISHNNTLIIYCILIIIIIIIY